MIRIYGASDDLVEIDGIIWVIVYNNEGKETERYPLE